MLWPCVICYHVIHTDIDDDLKEVLTKLHSVNYKWEELGTEIGLKDGALKAIAANRSTVQQCMRDVITEWLHGNGFVSTWQTIIDVLKTETVGEGALAKSIHKNITTDSIN